MGIDPGQKEAEHLLDLPVHRRCSPDHSSGIQIRLTGPLYQFITSVKDTALCPAIAVNEITHQAQACAALSFKQFLHIPHWQCST